jgi:hypothetical protein
LSPPDAAASVSVKVPLKHVHVVKPDTVRWSVEGKLARGHGVATATPPSANGGLAPPEPPDPEPEPEPEEVPEPDPVPDPPLPHAEHASDAARKRRRGGSTRTARAWKQVCMGES